MSCDSLTFGGNAYQSLLAKSVKVRNLRSGSIFRLENYIPAGMAKRKESLIQTFYEMSTFLID